MDADFTLSQSSDERQRSLEQEVSMQRRVVVTGVGPVSSIGIGKKAFWEKAKRGLGYFRNVDFPDVEIEQFKSRICSPVDAFTASDYFGDAKLLKRTGRATQYTAVGSYLALKDAGFTLKKQRDKDMNRLGTYILAGTDPLRCGVILGQAVSNSDVLLPAHITFLRDRGPKKINPFTLPQSNSNVGASKVSEIFGMRGTCYTISSACASATHAIGMGAVEIMLDKEDLVVTGGADVALEPYFFSGFDIIRALSARNEDPMKASRPFDQDRDGFVLGEGAGIVVLEELGHAVRRNARIYGELIGFGYSADAYNVVAPDPFGRGALAAISKAIEMAGITPDEIEYINAHGTSTILNDSTESYVIKQVCGDYAYKIPISSSKSYFGHTLGAAGGLESIVTLMIMEHGIIAPTSNLDNPDVEYVDRNTPELDKRCDLDYVPLQPREASVGIALNQSFGFGGQNGALIFKEYV
jgi:3-oxoacyl-[acyl-carrier-protein] synthase II